MDNIKKLYDSLTALITDEKFGTDVQNIIKNDNKAAGTRVRGKLQEVKSLAQDLRKAILEKRKN